MLTLAIDYGMGNTKFIFKFNNKIYKRTFESRVSYNESFNGYTTIINTKAYAFGEGRFAVDLGHNTKDAEIHRLLMYKAMIEAYKETKITEFNLAVTCSLDSYKVDRGASVRAFMSEIKEIEFEEENHKAILKINQITCYPECLVGALTTDLKLKKEDVVVVDIGTKNFQLLRILLGVPDIETSFSTKYGCDLIYESISDNLKVLNIGLDTPDAVKLYLTRTSDNTFDKINNVESMIIDFLENNIFYSIDKKLNTLGLNMYNVCMNVA